MKDRETKAKIGRGSQRLRFKMAKVHRGRERETEERETEGHRG